MNFPEMRSHQKQSPEAQDQLIPYDQDFILWLEQTIQLLTKQQYHAIDWEHLQEELESMGKSEKNALRSNLRVLLMHLLKYQYQPEKRTNSWLYTIFEHRTRLLEAFEDSPSLKRYYQENFGTCYQKARKEAALETGLSLNLFPEESPFSPEETLNLDFLPSYN